MKLARRIGAILIWLIPTLVLLGSAPVAAQNCGPTNPNCIVPTPTPCVPLPGDNRAINTVYLFNCSLAGGGTVTSVAAGCGTTTFGSAITSSGVVAAKEPVNAITATSYTIANGDCGTLTTFTNAAAIAATLPQANTPANVNFIAGWYEDVCTRGAGTTTITPTTSTINGAATLVLATGICARIVSDGTNYQVVTYGGGGGTPGGANTNVQFNNAGAFGGDAGFTYLGNGQATLALGTITTNLKALTITGTWNAAGVTFDAPILANITNTASALGSALLDIQQAGVSNLMLFNRTASTASPTLAIANGTNPTQICAYNTVDTLNNPTNYERFCIDWVVNSPSVTIATQFGGSGSQRNLLLRTPSNSAMTLAGASSQTIFNSSRQTLTVGNFFEYVGAGLTLANGLNSNISASGAFNVVSGPTAAFSVGGFFANGTNSGTRLFVYNSTAQAMTIVNQDASSSAANRILTLTGANVVLRTGTSFAQFIYDGVVANQWILVATN